MREFSFSSKGIGSIHAYRWEPEGEPRCIVQIIHGIADHAARYDEFARYLTAQGALVVAEDHMGHGKSTAEHTPLYFEGGWETAVDDTYELLRMTHEEFPHLPYFLFGHSMGSFFARDILYRYPDAPINACILCGTAWQPPLILMGGRALCAIERRRLGERKHSKLMHKLMFGAYNAKFHDARTPYDWVNSDPAQVDAYAADPFCGGEETTGIACDLLHGLKQIQRRKNLQKMPKALPILFIAGKSDPVGAMGKGVEKAAKKFKKCGMKSVELRLYDGRHEILNEPNRVEVYADVLAFLKSFL